MVLLAGYDDQRTPEKDSIEIGWKRTKVQEFLTSRGLKQARSMR
jgi:hypothetical protein